MKKKKRLKFKDLPDHKKILWMVADIITRQDIEFLSGQDRGHNRDKHALPMTYFKDTLDTSKLDVWYPLEVWELNRWSSPGYLDMTGHTRRAFSCIGIMAHEFNHARGPDNELDVLFPLFESLMRLKLTDWQTHFLSFLSYGLEKTTGPLCLFRLQIIICLVKISNETSFEKLRGIYEQLIADDAVMQKGVWGQYCNETWDPALAPETQPAFQFFKSSLIHGTAHMFAAKMVYHKAEYIDDKALSEGFKNLAAYIAKFGHDDLDDFLPITLPDLYNG